ncbi:MAG: hypothetical protein ACRDRW_02550 [Pseudonocardiaceae bacterium]
MTAGAAWSACKVRKSPDASGWLELADKKLVDDGWRYRVGTSRRAVPWSRWATDGRIARPRSRT